MNFKKFTKQFQTLKWMEVKSRQIVKIFFRILEAKEAELAGHEERDQSQSESQVQNLQREKAEVDQKIREYQNKLKANDSSKYQLKVKLQDFEKQIYTLQQDVKDCKKGLEVCRDPETQKRIADAEQAHRLVLEELDLIESEKRKIEESVTDLKMAKDDSERKKDQLLADMNEAKKLTHQHNSEIQRLKGIQKNKQVRFGQHVPVVNDLISKQKWEKQPPIGPIGDYISINPGFEKYTGLVEWLCGTMLHKYLVFDSRDKAKLTKILDRNVRDPRLKSIVQCKYQHQPITQNARFASSSLNHPVLKTVFQAISSSEPMVMRQLVEWQKIHLILMSQTQQEALQYIQDKVHGRRRLIFCFTFYH